MMTDSIKRLCEEIIHLADFHKMMMDTPNCNDCAKQENCEFAPG